MSQNKIILPTLPAGSDAIDGLEGTFSLPESFDFGAGKSYRWTRDDPSDPSAVWSTSNTGLTVLGGAAVVYWETTSGSGNAGGVSVDPSGTGSVSGATESGELVLELIDANGVPQPWIYIHGTVQASPPASGWARRINVGSNSGNHLQRLSALLYHPTNPILGYHHDDGGTVVIDGNTYNTIGGLWGQTQFHRIDLSQGKLDTAGAAGHGPGASGLAASAGYGHDDFLVVDKPGNSRDGVLYVSRTRFYSAGQYGPDWDQVDADPATNTVVTTMSSSSNSGRIARWDGTTLTSKSVSNFNRGHVGFVYDPDRFNAGGSGWQVYNFGRNTSSSYSVNIYDADTGKFIRFYNPPGYSGYPRLFQAINDSNSDLFFYCTFDGNPSRLFKIDASGVTAIFETMTSSFHTWTSSSSWSYEDLSKDWILPQVLLGNGSYLCTQGSGYSTTQNLFTKNGTTLTTILDGDSCSRLGVVAETANHIIVQARQGIGAISFSNGSSIPTGYEFGTTDEVNHSFLYLDKNNGTIKGAVLAQTSLQNGTADPNAIRAKIGGDDLFAFQATTVRLLYFGDGPWGSSTRTTVDWANPDFQKDNGAQDGSNEPIWIYKMRDDWGNFTVDEDTTGSEDPPGGNTGGGTETGTDIAAPYSLDWPAFAYEGETVSGTFQVDPSPSWQYSPIAEFKAVVNNVEYDSPFDTVDKYGDPARSGINLNGIGTLYLEQAKDNWPAGSTGIPADNTVEVRFEPDDQWFGDLEFYLNAYFFPTHDDAAGKFVGTKSPDAFVKTQYDNEPDRPRVAGDTFPDTVEEVAVGTAMTVEDPDNSGNYTWELSADHQPETWESGDPDFRTNTSTTSVTLTDDDGYTAGTVTISSQSGTTVNLTFTPAQYWNGTSEVWLRVDNNQGAEKSRWRRLPVKVEAVSNAPTAISPTDFGTFQEDTTADLAVSWTDPDVGPNQRAGRFTLQVKLTTGTTWVDLLEGELIDLGDVRIRLVAFDTDAQTATLRAEPKGNWNGSFAFDTRLKDNSDETELFSPEAQLIGTVSSAPDIPSRVVPSTMAKCRPNGFVFSTFSTFDPDLNDTEWFFEIAPAESGPWSTGPISVTNATVEVVDPDRSDRKTRVKATADQDKTGTYNFWIRVTDSTGRTSDPTLVKGHIATNQPGVWLQRLNRDNTPATVELLCPLTTVTDLNAVSSLDGPGMASVTVSASELRFRADQLDISGPELLDAGSTEVLITSGGKPIWCGPVSRYSVDATNPDGVVTIEAAGLASYLSGAPLEGSRTDPSGTTDFELADQSEIISGLFGSGGFADSHALTDGTIPTGTSSVISFDNSLTIAEAINRLQNEADSAEVYIDPDRTFRATAVRGVDRRPSVKFLSTAALSVDREKKSDQTVTAAIVTSALGFSGYHEDPDGVKKYGRLTRTVQSDALTSDLACNALAMEIVERAKSTAEVVRLSTYVMDAAPYSATDIEPGDLVGLNVDDPNLGKLAGDFRVISIDIAWGQDTPPGSTKISLILEPAVFVDGVLQGSRSSHVAEFYSMAYEALYR